MTVEELIDFEKDIAEEFNNGKIPYPVHLSGGNESQLRDIFKQVGPSDFVCSTWRSHYHALLRGVPPQEVKAAILVGRSITLTFPEHRFISSAIVGGMAPIAVGLAMAIKRDGGKEKVWLFVGDMGFCTGTVGEALRYAAGHDLPLNCVVEDNDISVLTPTKEVWGPPNDANIQKYHYKLDYPHAGAGVRVQF